MCFLMWRYEIRNPVRMHATLTFARFDSAWGAFLTQLHTCWGYSATVEFYFHLHHSLIVASLHAQPYHWACECEKERQQCFLKLTKCPRLPCMRQSTLK
jgi:hypothetical protein